jgi:hypothetical protein
MMWTCISYLALWAGFIVVTGAAWIFVLWLGDIFLD